MSTKMQKTAIANETMGVQPGLRYRFGTTSVIALVVVGAIMATGLNTYLVQAPESEVEATEPSPESEELDPSATEVPLAVDELPLSFEFMTTPGSSVDEPRQDQDPVPELDGPGRPDEVEDIRLAQVTPDPEEAADADADADEPVAQAGEEVEGLELARLTVLNAEDPRVLAGWLHAETAVFEIYTDRGLFLGIGTSATDSDGFRALRFARLGDFVEDKRSDLRMSGLDSSRLPTGVIRAQLGAQTGVFDIQRIELVFTRDAAARIAQAQASILARLREEGITATADELNLVICIKGTEVLVETISRLSDGTSLGAPTECGQ